MSLLVHQGQTTVPVNTPTVDVVLPFTFDPDHAVVKTNSSYPGTCISPKAGTTGSVVLDDLWVDLELIGTDTVRITRRPNPSLEVEVFWDLLYFVGAPGDPDEFTVIHRAVRSMPNGQASRFWNLNSEGVSTPSQGWLNIACVIEGMSVPFGQSADGPINFAVRSDYNLLFGAYWQWLHRYGSSYNIDYRTALLDFNGSDWVQEAVTFVPSVTNLISDSNFENVALINDVGDWDNAFILLVNAQTSQTGLRDQRYIVLPGTTTTSLRVKFTGVAPGANDTAHIVVLSNPNIRVSHSNAWEGGETPIPGESFPFGRQTETKPFDAVQIGASSVSSVGGFSQAALDLTSAIGQPRNHWHSTIRDLSDVEYTRSASTTNSTYFRQSVVNFIRPIPIEVDGDVNVVGNIYLNPDNLYTLLRQYSVVDVDPYIDLAQVAYGPEFRTWEVSASFSGSSSSIDLAVAIPNFAPSTMERTGIRLLCTQDGGIATGALPPTIDHRDLRVWVTKDSPSQVTLNRSTAAQAAQISVTFQVIQYLGVSGGPNEIRFLGQAVNTIVNGQYIGGAFFFQMGVDAPATFRTWPAPCGVASDEVGPLSAVMHGFVLIVLGLEGLRTIRLGTVGPCTVYYDMWEFRGTNWKLGRTALLDRDDDGTDQTLVDVNNSPVDIDDWDQAIIAQDCISQDDWNATWLAEPGPTSSLVTARLTQMPNSSFQGLLYAIKNLEMSVFRGSSIIDMNDVTGDREHTLTLLGSNPSASSLEFVLGSMAAGSTGVRHAQAFVNYQQTDDDEITIQVTDTSPVVPSELEVVYQTANLPGGFLAIYGDVDVLGSLTLSLANELAQFFSQLAGRRVAFDVLSARQIVAEALGALQFNPNALSGRQSAIEAQVARRVSTSSLEALQSNLDALEAQQSTSSIQAARSSSASALEALQSGSDDLDAQQSTANAQTAQRSNATPLTGGRVRQDP